MDHIVAVAAKAKVMSSRRSLPQVEAPRVWWRPIPFEDSALCFHLSPYHCRKATATS